MDELRTRKTFAWPAWERQVSLASTVEEYYALTVSIPDHAFPRYPEEQVAMNETPGRQPTQREFWERERAVHGPDVGTQALMRSPRIVSVSWPFKRPSRIV